MPIYDWKCEKCGGEFEYIASIHEETIKCMICWDADCKKIPPQGKSPSFKLVYNNKTDMVDWDGNTSRYWDQYKKMKADGLKPELPDEDKKTKEMKDRLKG